MSANTVKVPTYMTVEEYEISNGSYIMSASQSKVLPAGAFVKPIHDSYLPRHIKDSDEYMRSKLTDKNVFCYCFFGIVLLPWSIIREVR